MSFIITPAGPNHGDGSLGNLDPMANGSRGPLRHFLVGSLTRIRASQQRLHTRRYIDIQQWSPPMAIDEDGLIIQPTLGEFFTFLQLPDYTD